MGFTVVDPYRERKKFVEFMSEIFKPEKVPTDTYVFRLYYKLTVWMVFIFTLFVACIHFKHYDPISCISNQKSVKVNKKKYGLGLGAFYKQVTWYCWSKGTYLVTNADQEREMYPGVVGMTGPHDEIKYYTHYNALYLYALIMYLVLLTPRFIWCNYFEKGMMWNLVKDLCKTEKPVPIKLSDVQEKEKQLACFIHRRWGRFREYAFGYILCECLNVLASLSLMYLWDLISDHELSKHGASLAYLQTERSLRTDPMAKVFPIITKCTFTITGFSGNLEPHDFLCLLPLNMITEGAAVWFWFYYKVLLSIGICSLLFRLMAIFSKRLRMQVLALKAPMLGEKFIETLGDECSYSEWFVIVHISHVVQHDVFRETMEKLVMELRRQRLRGYRFSFDN